MAGRAGRRGKDDKGVVIYLPDREPATPEEMFKMMKGARPPIESRMDFHYDFVLKTLQASKTPLKWLEIMKHSYWYKQQEEHIHTRLVDLEKLKKTLSEIKVEEPYLSGCEKRLELEQKMKSAVNAEKKQLQRELDGIKNKQLGPKWNKALADYHTYQKMKVDAEWMENEIKEMTEYYNIDDVVQFLHHVGYIRHTDSMTLTQDDLGLKGVLATEVNEGHPILMTELYVDGSLHHLSGNELVAVLACFQEKKESENQPQSLSIPSTITAAIQRIQKMAESFQTIENEIGYPVEGYWTISTQMVEPMWRWMNGEHASVICKEHDLFEGNFIRTVMKLANMLDEWLAMATYCQHTEQVEKITEVRSHIVRDVVVSDSLYLRL
jgi:superfamily II RNA helicase